MKISGLNLDISWKNKEENFSKITEQFSDVVADIYLLPEMFATGFCMELAEIADRNGETLKWMQEFARDKDVAVCGSVSVEDSGKFYNRMYFVKPDGSWEKYDKRHLFSFSDEDKVYTAGKERVVVNYNGFRILLQVCYDLRFPVFSRNKGDYDLALYVANWPEKRVAAWQHLLKARAIENLAGVFGLNRIGKDGNDLVYTESSHAFFADGTELSTKDGNIISAEFNLTELQDFRSHFRFLDDGDRFAIED